MGRICSIALTVLAVLVLAGGCHSGKSAEVVGPSAATPKDVVVAAKATIEKWRQAYEIRSVDALSELYAHDVDLVVVQEGTAYLGWSSVQAMLKDRLTRADTIRVRLKDMQVLMLAPDVAYALATMTRELGGTTTTVMETGTLTLVLRKQGTAWLITSEHYSYKRS